MACFCTGRCRELGYCPNQYPPPYRPCRPSPLREQGWECQRCHRVNSPSVAMCPCYRPNTVTVINHFVSPPSDPSC